jgi:hypothetical protein
VTYNTIDRPNPNRKSKGDKGVPAAQTEAEKVGGHKDENQTSEKRESYEQESDETDRDIKRVKVDSEAVGDVISPAVPPQEESLPAETNK